MKHRILQVITAMLLIITLTMANFLLLCTNVVSYAADVVNMDKSTNHKNIEFMAYFKDENGNKISERDICTNAENLKLYFLVSVKKEGYFNGNIILNNTNFVLQNEILNNSISKIENNVIYLNQINAGEDKEIEVNIELIKNEEFDINLIDLTSQISIEGIYRDSTEKDLKINAQREVKLKFVSPYTNIDENVILSQNVITNKVFEINGKNKRVVQVEIESGLKDNLFPVKATTINIQVPEISNERPENILINSNDYLVTNGKRLSQDNWNYDETSKLIVIKIENNENQGKISWKKQGTDKFIVTYIFSENVEINNDNLKVNSQIKLYDDNKTLINAENQITLDNNVKDSIVTSNIIQGEANIYKGNLYEGIAREITYKNIININLNGVANKIIVKENKQTIGNEILNAVYKTSKINKTSIDNILGELGILNIKVGENVIQSINKNSSADENGDIVITYPENVEEVIFEIIQPERIGKLEIQSTKTINKNNKNALRNGNAIISNTSVNYIINNKEDFFDLGSTEAAINLLETQTSADLQFNRSELSAMTSNDNVEFRIILNSKEEKDELFKNPIVKLQLPEKIEEIKVNSIKLLYEDELKIASANLNGNTIEIALNGEQTKYKEEAIQGAIIIINANLKTSTKIPSSTEQIKLTFTNEKAVNYKDNAELIKNIDIVSYVGVVTINQVPEYGIELVNNSGIEAAELAVSDTEKNVTIEKKIINNNENEISNVKILGTFPTKESIENNNIDIEVSNLVVSGIDASRVKVYYSNNVNATKDLDNTENNWEENISDSKNVKKYLVVIDKLDIVEEANITYQIKIPANLEYSKSAEEGYSVYYNNLTIEEEINAKNIRLATKKGTIVETTLKSLVAGKESESIKENGILRYEIIVANTGSENVDNVKVIAKVPEGTKYVNSNQINSEIDIDELAFVDEEKKDIEINVNNLTAGQEVTEYYEVLVNEGMAEKKIMNAVETQYGEISKTSNEVDTLVENGNLELQLISVDAINNIVMSGHQYRYVLYITNKSENDLQDVDVTINTSDLLNVSEIYYIDFNNKANIVDNTKNINISKILSGETIEVSINTDVKIFKDDELKDVFVYATANIDNKEHSSNEIELIAKSDLNISLNVKSENSGSYVKAGDIIKYDVTIKNESSDNTKNVVLNNWISNDVTLMKVLRNGEELSEENYSLKIDNDKNQKLLKIIEETFEKGQSVNYQIEVVANSLYGNTKAIELISEYSIQIDALEIENAKVSHILQPEDIDSNNSNNNSENNNNENSNNGNNNQNQETNPNYKIISGVAWLDENEDGQKQTNESNIEGIVVKLLNVETNEFVKDSNGNIVTTTTTSTGFYSFSKIEQGQYLVIFEYDNAKYGITEFEKDDVSDESNSNVIAKTININGIEQKVAATEVINVNDDNISNINIGLIIAKKYDLRLDKYISKVTIQNSKIVTNTYNDAILAKQEIDAKQVNSTIVVVEYTIRVTNNGDVSAYVKKIADYLSSDYKFNSELNKDWYQSGDEVYCTSLSNEEIKPGESKDVVLTVIKEMTENNTGLVNNTAEIVSSYNEKGLIDINSTEGNKIKGENDMASADLIISIKTGQVVITLVLIIAAIGVLGIAIILLKKLIYNKR